MVKSNYFTTFFTPSLFDEIQPHILSLQNVQQYGNIPEGNIPEIFLLGLYEATFQAGFYSYTLYIHN